VHNVETFLTLKKCVERIVKTRQANEDRNTEIVETIQIINNNYIKIKEYDYAKILDKERFYVDYEKKIDDSIYYVDSNIPKYRQELKDDIRSFGKEIKKVNEDLNNEILNRYSKDSYSALFFIEDKSIPIKKLVDKSVYFQNQEKDIESDERSKFENLEQLNYEYDLKSK